MRLSILAQAALSAALATTAHAQSIYFSSTPDGYGTACVEPPSTFPSVVTLHVFADTSGLPGGGMTGAEFAIRGLDEGNPPAQPYYTEWRPNPQATITLGDPLGSGVNVAFADCQTGQFILLGSLVIINTGDTELRKLQITARQPPNNANFDCPLLVHCDAPYYTLQCVWGGYAYLNISRDPPPATNPDPPDGATGVPLQVTLRWYTAPVPQEICEPGTIWMDIYFGTNPDPPYLNSSTGPRQWVLPLLQPETTYYWRIQAGTNTSPVWSFTTGSTIGVAAKTWGEVRGFYR